MLDYRHILQRQCFTFRPRIFIIWLRIENGFFEAVSREMGKMERRVKTITSYRICWDSFVNTTARRRRDVNSGKVSSPEVVRVQKAKPGKCSWPASHLEYFILPRKIFISRTTFVNSSSNFHFGKKIAREIVYYLKGRLFCRCLLRRVGGWQVAVMRG